MPAELSLALLVGESLDSVKQPADAIRVRTLIDGWNERCDPLIWTKTC